MTDFNKTLQPGDYQNGLFTAVIEIPKGSFLKVEYDRHRALFVLDRVEPSIFTKPESYGFIPGTLDEDGDELDCLIVCAEPIPMGVVVNAKLIGVMNFEDDGDMDHKIIGVPADNRNTGDSINSLDDLPTNWKLQLEHHFNHYKDLKKPNSTKVLGWGGVDDAKKVIEESINRYKQQTQP
ncbi:MAG TPA: inorganic diphosphatase [Candidatus Saccharimonadales bacterium]|jgi:inorganic pyrophosphatase|nr:inorganic diphosphatase [Candidatus Saccharimonadales bacterium]